MNRVSLAGSAAQSVPGGRRPPGGRSRADSGGPARSSRECLTLTKPLRYCWSARRSTRKTSPEHMARLLVVDDDEGDRAVLRAILEHAQHQVWLAKDGAEALSQFQGNGIEVVITDL